jgi:hypothetical protein
MNRVLGWIFFLVVTVAGMVTALCSFNTFSARTKNSINLAARSTISDGQKSTDPESQPHPPLPRLPETSPPPGLPIVAWGKRDHFAVIRNPRYWSADEGNKALARDEPVLGLVINGESWAFSTNQLNDHEMVVDTLADTPVLVTY